jgi:hypothetical protein
MDLVAAPKGTTPFHGVPSPAVPLTKTEPDSGTKAPEKAQKAGPARPTGTLFLSTRPWSKVYLGGRSLGTTPILGDEPRMTIAFDAVPRAA